MNLHADIVVVGGGAGGIGAALAAARMGYSVLLFEQTPVLGGTMVRAGVSNWEPGVGGTGIPFDLYRRMKRIPGAVGITRFGRHVNQPQLGEPKFPGGELLLDPAHAYRDTLCRHGAPGGRWNYAYGLANWHSVVFEPEAMRRVVEEALAETGRCQVRTDATFSKVVVQEGHLASIVLSDGSQVKAHFFIDATGDAALASFCGCPTTSGEESRATYGEPSAPVQETSRVNGVTLIYRIADGDGIEHTPVSQDIPIACWWRSAFPDAAYTQYPCGDFAVNMLPTMEGAEYLALSPEAAYAECRRRVWAHWRDCRLRFPEFRRKRLVWIAPALGIREARRIVGEYVLTEHDVRAGLCCQPHQDIVAIADHAFDTHGCDGTGCRELNSPYGVPFRCLLPRGIDNLLAASKSASFSARAASSCRLSRTIMQLGQAAGTAAALALADSCALRALPSARLRDALHRQYASLMWPPSAAMVEHLMAEDAP